MNKVWLIIQREYLTRVKKRSFIIMTILGPLLFVGFMAGAFYLSMNDSKTYDVVLTDSEGLFGNVLFEEEFVSSKQIRYHIHYGSMSDIAFQESAYDLKVDLVPELIYAKRVNMYYKDQPGVIVVERVSDQIEKNFERIKLEKENIDPEQYESLTTPISLVLFDIENVNKESTNTEVGGMIGFVLAIMIFVFIMLYGQQIMRGVMEEKTSRIVEVLVSSVRPFQLMLGKILGVAFVGLTQFLLWAALSFILMSAAQAFLGDAFSNPSVLVEQQMSKEVLGEVIAEVDGNGDAVNIFFGYFYSANIPFILGMYLFYFIGGYLLYGSLYAAIGSAVDADTDTQQFMLPLMMPLMFGYIISVMAFTNPASSLIYWCSIIPLTSPVVMMVRVGMMGMGYEAIDWLSIGLSMALLILGFLFATWLASKIYRVGILMYGKKVSYKEIWKWLRYY